MKGAKEKDGNLRSNVKVLTMFFQWLTSKVATLPPCPRGKNWQPFWQSSPIHMWVEQFQLVSCVLLLQQL
jgi:hypothetical protein